jgi:hypothetical protein
VSKRLVRYEDPEAKCETEPYHADIAHGGVRFFIRLSDGRRMPWGRTMSHAWRNAYKRLQADKFNKDCLATRLGLKGPETYK